MPPGPNPFDNNRTRVRCVVLGIVQLSHRSRQLTKPTIDRDAWRPINSTEC